MQLLFSSNFPMDDPCQNCDASQCDCGACMCEGNDECMCDVAGEEDDA